MNVPRTDESAHARPQVVVIDDDESVRESLPDLLREFGCDVTAFSSAGDYLATGLASHTDCLFLDFTMPGMSGMDLQRELAAREYDIPIVYITANEDRSLRPRVLRAGAIDCLFKPFSDTALREALCAAIGSRGCP